MPLTVRPVHCTCTQCLRLPSNERIILRHDPVLSDDDFVALDDGPSILDDAFSIPANDDQPETPVIPPDYLQCSHCDEPAAPYTWPLFLESQRVITSIGETGFAVFCNGCLSAHYSYCDECVGYYIDRWGNRDCPNGPHGPCECDDCYECDERRGNEDDDDSDLINSYGYKPRPIFRGTGPTYLGLELEVDTSGGRNRSLAVLANERLGSLAYLKEDGSVNGFEIVTHPCSYEHWRSEVDLSVLTDLRRNGARTLHDTGIHVHVSRTAFNSPCHLYRWMKFFYRNAQQVQSIARRESDMWAAFCPSARKHVKTHVKGQRVSGYYPERSEERRVGKECRSR